MLTTKNGQSVFDIAIQAKGDVSRAVEIADQNSISVTDSIPAGTELDLDQDEISIAVKYYQENEIFPGTYAEVTGGIESMGIGMDFKID